MSAALNVNWGEVQTLAVAIGVREAARQLGLPEEAVKRRCSREGWLRDLPRSQELPPTVMQPKANVPNVPNAGDVLRQRLAERGAKSRLSLAEGLGKAADAVQDMKVGQIIENAHELKAITNSLATVHGWEAKSAAVTLDLRLTSDRQAPQTIDAEWSEAE